MTLPDSGGGGARDSSCSGRKKIRTAFAQTLLFLILHPIMWCPSWRHTGLKGNPVRVRNSTRCCNPALAARLATRFADNATVLFRDGKAGRIRESQKTCLIFFGFGNKATYYHETHLRSAFRNRLGSGIDLVDAQPTVPLASQSIRSSCLSRSVPCAVWRPGAIRAVFHRPPSILPHSSHRPFSAFFASIRSTLSSRA